MNNPNNQRPTNSTRYQNYRNGESSMSNESRRQPTATRTSFSSGDKVVTQTLPGRRPRSFQGGASNSPANKTSREYKPSISNTHGQRGAHSKTTAPTRNRQNNSDKSTNNSSNNNRSEHTKIGGHKHRLNTMDRSAVIPEVAPGNIRIITLGGVEGIGKNMSAIEIGNDIIVIDCGFAFKNENTPGIDYIIPNTKYLEDRKDRIRGVIITHGHLDHTGGIAYVFPRIGNPPIYCRSFTSLMIQKRQEEFKHNPPLDINVVETNDRIKLGEQYVRFFGITHTIPDSMGIIIETPYGNLINQADFKLDHIDGEVSDAEKSVYGKLAEESNLLMMCDSTNVENEGFSTPEWMVHRDLETMISQNNNGRIILGAFASQVDRLTALLRIAEKHGRHVVLEGRSMKTNLGVAEQAGIFTPKQGTVISAEESMNIPPHKVLILSTGSQGEEFAAMMRMANRTHKTLAYTERDTVILSASIVPGNENAVARLKDEIARSGADIVTYRNSDLYVHGSGHGNREELKWLHNQVKPKFFIPQHGSHYMLRLHATLAKKLGMTEDRIIVPHDGAIMEIQENGTKLVKLKQKAMSNLVTVDGFSIGNMQDVVIRDRQILSEDGIFLIVMTVNPRTGQLRKSPDIISRGFIYLKEERTLINEARKVIQQCSENHSKSSQTQDFDKLKSDVTDRMRKLLLQKTGKRPLVIPVLITI